MQSHFYLRSQGMTMNTSSSSSITVKTHDSALLHSISSYAQTDGLIMRFWKTSMGLMRGDTLQKGNID